MSETPELGLFQDVPVDVASELARMHHEYYAGGTPLLDYLVQAYQLGLRKPVSQSITGYVKRRKRDGKFSALIDSENGIVSDRAVSLYYQKSVVNENWEELPATLLVHEPGKE